MPFIQLNPIVFWVLVIWTLVWKGWALWEAARRGQKGWFLALFVISSLGVLEAIYIFFIAKAHHDKDTQKIAD
ncbi:MAG: hypothetical protein QG669_539 [Patescibacteria group bacterium]|jgi:methionyl-tRNA synthetase|nr:hypothetical protein [Patescibacteria group bacterium]